MDEFILGVEVKSEYGIIVNIRNLLEVGDLEILLLSNINFVVSEETRISPYSGTVITTKNDELVVFANFLLK